MDVGHDTDDIGSLYLDSRADLKSFQGCLLTVEKDKDLKNLKLIRK